jgi:uncharacterized RDD family membrane protein YckC
VNGCDSAAATQGAAEGPAHHPVNDPVTAPTPSLRRRLACFLYEGVLLFGVVMIAGLLYSVFTQQRHALQGRTGMIVFLFLVFGAYFVVFWSRSGQTLAMLTWHVRLVMADGRPVGKLRAACRYVLSYLWFLPALAAVHFAGLTGGWVTFFAVLAGVLAYAALTRLHPDRQYWHDAVCKTRLVTWYPPHRRKKS